MCCKILKHNNLFGPIQWSEYMKQQDKAVGCVFCQADWPITALPPTASYGGRTHVVGNLNLAPAAAIPSLAPYIPASQPRNNWDECGQRFRSLSPPLFLKTNLMLQLGSDTMFFFLLLFFVVDADCACRQPNRLARRRRPVMEYYEDPEEQALELEWLMAWEEDNVCSSLSLSASYSSMFSRTFEYTSLILIFLSYF